jgi:hypothetical protein
MRARFLLLVLLIVISNFSMELNEASQKLKGGWSGVQPTLS